MVIFGRTMYSTFPLDLESLLISNERRFATINQPQNIKTTFAHCHRCQQLAHAGADTATVVAPLFVLG